MPRVYNEPIEVEQENGIVVAFNWREKRFLVKEVIGRWRIEGRWWEDGRDREYWRVETKSTATWDLFYDHKAETWTLERMWDL